MSGHHSGRSSSNPYPYRSADEIVRSILDDNTSPADVSPSGELYRAIERYHSPRRPTGNTQRDLGRTRPHHWPVPSPPRSTMSSDPNSGAPRRLSREAQSSDSSPLYNLPSSAPSLPSLRSVNTIRRPWVAPPPSNPVGRHGRSRPSARSRLHMSLDDDGLTPRDRAWIYGTDDPNAQLQAVLNYTRIPSQSHQDSAEPSPEPTEENRRVKRRKLDSDGLSAGFRGFRYGRHGQVEPGQLTMELVSCDGGTYLEDGQKYTAENILKNDHTVYCTETPRCNIILRHQGATVFTLKELVVKAPRSNFTSPVQEGMVFVSMTSDRLLARTAQYQIQYAASRSSRRTDRDSQPLAPIVSIRHNEDGSSMTRSQVRARRLYNLGLEDEDNDFRVAQIPSEFSFSPPPFHVTTECSDDEADNAYPPGDWRALNRIGSLPFESDSSDDPGPDDFSFSGTDYRLRRRRNRSSNALAEAAEAAQVATQEAVRAVGGELMVPHARFFIERHKSKCTIKFDPPVSGRFILLKMWSPQRDPHANIDIQAVIAKGFAGPRFFPSVEVR
ncbi:hypothetical protein GGR56DRAFT_625557 [Xylariaceae sp. FL0804]|nr:hypothetical protein GGR56DRAFT_625557 [Xylariaceae sp. FL0804]